jgi:KTSC domain
MTEPTKVQSSNIHAISYDAGKMIVHFKGGGIYEFHDVPEDLHKQFMAAESKGSFFHHNVKGKFKTSKMEPIK